METQAPTFRQIIIPLIFMLTAIALGLGAFLAFGGSTPLSPAGYKFWMLAPDASDVYPGSDVDISGVKIGHVVSITRSGSHARINIELAPRFAPLHSGATAIKRTKSLLGEGYIEIAPGPRTATPIPDGGELAPSHVKPAETLDDVLDTFPPATRGELRGLFSGMAGAFAGRAGQLSEVLGYSAPTMANLSTVLGTLDAQRGQLGQLFANSANVLNAMASRTATLQAAVTSGDQVLAATARSRTGLETTLRALPGFLTELRGASNTIATATGDLDRAVTALTPTAEKLGPALGAIDSAAPQFRGLFDDLPSVIAAGDRSLPDVSRTISAAGSSFKTVYPVSRQVIPTLQLLAALRGSINSFFANIAQFANGTVSANNGQTETAILGIPSVWNETLVGWTRRLPSNRPNPYPKPGAELEIGHGGLLSYDCRQLGNPLYIPPTGGTGATPCRLQGPWVFNGKSRYYPHLTLAPP